MKHNESIMEAEPPVTKPATRSAKSLGDEPPILKADEPPAVTPRAINSIGDIVDSDAVQGTRFTGPVISGNPDDGVPGIAMLHKRARISFALGSFNIPVMFPAGAILLKLYTIKNVLYNGTTPTVALELTQGGTLMQAAPVALDSVATVIESNITQLLPTNRTVWLHVIAGGATQGNATIMIMYSVPAKVVQS